nr:MAG TPA: hypothetical protein [Caudoviricetes sp.]
MKEINMKKINATVGLSRKALNFARNLMITSMVSGTATGMTMDVTSKAIDGIAYAITGEGLTGKAKTVSLMASAATGVYVGVKAGQMTNYLISKYEDDLAQRDAAKGLQDDEDEEEERSLSSWRHLCATGSGVQTEFKETDEVPAPEKK